MATHPAQNGCLCEWSGDDHYPKFVKWNPACPRHEKNPRGKLLSEMTPKEILLNKAELIVSTLAMLNRQYEQLGIEIEKTKEKFRRLLDEIEKTK